MALQSGGGGLAHLQHEAHGILVLRILILVGRFAVGRGIAFQKSITAPRSAVASATRSYINYIYMRLEWDERKNRLNQKKHGIAFSLAARVFADECRILEKDRVDEETGEQRWHAIGRVGGAAIYIVVHVYRGEKDGEEIIRIVSARDANQRESGRYFQQAAH
jgi:uncharacterized DUF497 family protein